MSATADAIKPKTSDAPSKDGPIIVDIGKKSRKQIRELRRGTGKLLDELNGVIQELRAAGKVSASAQPVFVVVRQKRGRRNGLWPMS